MRTDVLSAIVVDDEPLIRMDIAEYLRDHGVDVIEAANSTQALAIVKSGGQLDVLLTDVDMPGGVDGIELAWIVSRQLPDTRIILTSGNHDVRHRDMPAMALFLPKPVSLERLASVVFDHDATRCSRGTVADVMPTV